ncbi:MAG: hypothetical protein ABJZ55_00395 [Fuerstiella sp.]
MELRLDFTSVKVYQVASGGCREANGKKSMQIVFGALFAVEVAEYIGSCGCRCEPLSRGNLAEPGKVMVRMSVTYWFTSTPTEPDTFWQTVPPMVTQRVNKWKYSRRKPASNQAAID